MTKGERAALKAAVDERRRAAEGTPDAVELPQPGTKTGGRPYSVVHGTETAYVYYRCRCDSCREAGVIARRLRRQRAVVTVHDANGYRKGCRCAVCRAAHAEQNRKYVRRRAAA